MPDLYTIQEEIEEDLCKVIAAAWSTAGFGPLKHIFVSEPEEATTVSSLPHAALVLASAISEDDDAGAICSESSRLAYEVYLQAAKPRGRTLESEKRQRAQQLRTAIKAAVAAGDIRHASLIVWRGDSYREEEDFRIAALSDAYVIRVSYEIVVEWQD